MKVTKYRWLIKMVDSNKEVKYLPTEYYLSDEDVSYFTKYEVGTGKYIEPILDSAIEVEEFDLVKI